MAEAPIGRRVAAVPTIVISGAARGIGRATAERFARAGYRVGVYDVDVAAAKEWTAGDPAYVVGELDVTAPAQWEVVLADFVSQAGHLDILVNNAGVLYTGPFADADYAADRRIVDINVVGTLAGCRAAYPYLRVREGAQVVNLASAAAIYGIPDLAAYSATKFAVRGLTEALEQEWEADGIRVLSMWPLFVRTGMLDGVETASTNRLGIRLEAADVAAAIYDATRPRRRLVRSVHIPVGLQAKALAAGSRMSPAFLTRAVNALLTRG